MPNFEQPKFESPEQALTQRAEKILENIGLKPEDLKGKVVLDIGAGDAVLARVANKKWGAKVFSLEKDLELVKKEFKDFSTQDANYAQGTAEATPFKEKVFDLLISNGAPPIISKTKEEVEKILREGYRILKNNGEWRIGHGYLNAEVFFDELKLPNEMPIEERIKNFRKASDNFMREKWPGETKVIQKSEDPCDIYYILTKKE